MSKEEEYQWVTLYDDTLMPIRGVKLPDYNEFIALLHRDGRLLHGQRRLVEHTRMIIDESGELVKVVAEGPIHYPEFEDLGWLAFNVGMFAGGVRNGHAPEIVAWRRIGVVFSKREARDGD